MVTDFQISINDLILMVMPGGERFKRARSVTPFADQAIEGMNMQRLLQIALNHGINDVRQFKGVSASEVSKLVGEDVLQAMRRAAEIAEQNGEPMGFLELLSLYINEDEENERAKRMAKWLP